MIHKTAILAQSVEFGESVAIGSNTVIYPHVSIADNVKIGRNCIIGPGTHLGTYGFGYFWDEEEGWNSKDHEFTVVIGDNVHIGANTVIDRGSWRDTVIGSDTKIDNLVHIAHNVRIGKHVLVIAHAMVAGSVNIEDGAWIGPSSSINQRLTIHEGGFVGTGAVVTKDVPARMVVAGVPAKVLRERRDTDC